MPEINRLSSLDSLQLGDLLAVYSQNNGDARKASLSLLVSFLNESLTFPTPQANGFETQRAAPNADFFNVSVNDTAENTHLILTPFLGYEEGTITLPSVDTAIDKQEVLVNTTQQVKSISIDGNGASVVVGQPTALGADSFFRLKYDLGTKTWFRVG